MGKTKIEWATDSWNPIRALGWDAILDERMLLAPLHWRKQRRIFVCSTTDLFGEWVKDKWLDRIFAVMALCPRHTFQVLTKRPKRMRRYLTTADDERLGLPKGGGDVDEWPLANVWLGISAEDQAAAGDRIPDLLATPAAVRFVSAEPLLAPLSLRWLHGVRRLDWVICGGESGPGARPMHQDWARSLRNQCAAAGVPFFFKQWGEWAPHKVVAGGDLGGDVRNGTVRIVHPSGRTDKEVYAATEGRNTEPGSRYMARVGKRRAGRVLDGVEHNAFPAG